jgi:hypothetical protein
MLLSHSREFAADGKRLYCKETLRHKARRKLLAGARLALCVLSAQCMSGSSPTPSLHYLPSAFAFFLWRRGVNTRYCNLAGGDITQFYSQRQPAFEIIA